MWRAQGTCRRVLGKATTCGGWGRVRLWRGVQHRAQGRKNVHGRFLHFRALGRGVNALFSSAISASYSTGAGVTPLESDGIENKPKEIYRADYRASVFAIDNVDMSFLLELDETVVTTRSSIRKLDSSSALVLDGEELELLSVAIDDEELNSEDYIVTPTSLIIGNDTLLRYPETFELTTIVRINPQKNTALAGLYTSSNNILCTQCEALGFRRITYHLDRPDVLSRYRVYMEGDKEKFPILLSNGNLLSSGAVTTDNSRHFALWEDPFQKPSYLFALVAGPLVSLSDSFTTRSGKVVKLGIYSKKSLQSDDKKVSVDSFRHALECLKLSMSWDEEVFGLECDIDTYNVVAVDDFNMGAMENKGLNIFNSAYVLADPGTATDADYGRILSVIGHEYFHNWTGNRITLRDWFQLTLKEGLTVFRDQWFTADLFRGNGLQRIEDVSILRNNQFLEDYGPTAHPVRPESYIAMDNFYTNTVYLKGAEIVRMYHTMLGEAGFLRGMKLYVSRHDGQAVTCDDFLAAMSDANPNNSSLRNFGRWYEQPGTPHVTVERAFLDTSSKTFSITFRQKNCKIPTNLKSDLLPPLTIPIKTAIFDKTSGVQLDSALFILDEEEGTFHFENVDASSIIVSPLQAFSAPVRLSFPQQTDSNLMFLLQHEEDAFVKWECQQKISSNVILESAKLYDTYTIKEARIPEEYINAFKKILLSVKEKSATQYGAVAALMKQPSYSSLLRHLNEETRDCSMGKMIQVVDIDSLHQARAHVLHELSVAAEEELLSVYEFLTPSSTDYIFSNEEVGRRSLRNECLNYLTARKYSYKNTPLLLDELTKEEAIAHTRVNLACDQYYTSCGTCMTDSLSALSSLLSIYHPIASTYKENALDHFLLAADRDPLVTNKWFALQAAADTASVYADVLRLRNHPEFKISNPNSVRALVGTFSSNTPHFHHKSGRGYDFMADFVLQLDNINPQMASKLAHSLSQWNNFDVNRQALMKAALRKIADCSTHKLSSDTFEIVHKSLEQAQHGQ